VLALLRGLAPGGGGAGARVSEEDLIRRIWPDAGEGRAPPYALAPDAGAARAAPDRAERGAPAPAPTPLYVPPRPALDFGLGFGFAAPAHAPAPAPLPTSSYFSHADAGALRFGELSLDRVLRTVRAEIDERFGSDFAGALRERELGRSMASVAAAAAEEIARDARAHWDAADGAPEGRGRARARARSDEYYYDASGGLDGEGGDRWREGGRWREGEGERNGDGDDERERERERSSSPSLLLAQRASDLRASVLSATSPEAARPRRGTRADSPADASGGALGGARPRSRSPSRSPSRERGDDARAERWEREDREERAERERQLAALHSAQQAQHAQRMAQAQRAQAHAPFSLGAAAPAPAPAPGTGALGLPPRLLPPLLLSQQAQAQAQAQAHPAGHLQPALTSSSAPRPGHAQPLIIRVGDGAAGAPARPQPLYSASPAPARPPSLSQSRPAPLSAGALFRPTPQEDAALRAQRAAERESRALAALQASAARSMHLAVGTGSLEHQRAQQQQQQQQQHLQPQQSQYLQQHFSLDGSVHASGADGGFDFGASAGVPGASRGAGGAAAFDSELMAAALRDIEQSGPVVNVLSRLDEAVAAIDRVR